MLIELHFHPHARRYALRIRLHPALPRARSRPQRLDVDEKTFVCAPLRVNKLSGKQGGAETQDANIRSALAELKAELKAEMQALIAK